MESEIDERSGKLGLCNWLARQPPTRPLALPRFSLVPVDEITDLQPPAWLIEGLMEIDSTVVLYGPSGCGKSFLAIDWAMCVATGNPWHGRTVRQGPVVYVIGEGARNVGKRIRAWKEENGFPEIPEAFIVREPVQLRQGDQVKDLLLRIQSLNLRPRMVVFDTFARCFVGGDENSARDVGEFVHVARKLQEILKDATILIVHHTGKSHQEMERGSSALRAGVDAMILANGDGKILEVSNNKQKDLEKFEDIHLHMVEKMVGVDTASGEEITSLVLREATRGRGKSDHLSPAEQRAFGILGGLGEEVKTGEWQEALNQAFKQEVSDKTLDNWRKALVSKGMIEAIPGRRGYYRLTEMGASAIGTPSIC